MLRNCLTGVIRQQGIPSSSAADFHAVSRTAFSQLALVILICLSLESGSLFPALTESERKTLQKPMKSHLLYFRTVFPLSLPQIWYFAEDKAPHMSTSIETQNIRKHITHGVKYHILVEIQSKKSNTTTLKD